MSLMDTIVLCRSCECRSLQPLLDLGEVPLANALLTREELDETEQKFPLTLVFCPACSLVQIEQTVDPSALFREYFYLSSFSSTMLEHAREEAELLAGRFSLGKSSLAVEIASNDGYLLKNFIPMKVPVLGIEPAKNAAVVAEKEGIPTLCEFFGAALATRLRREGRRADIVIANNVLAHVADLHSMVEGMSVLLKDRGCAVIEVPYVGTMIENAEFDTIYHEHLCYFSLHSVRAVLNRHGLAVTDVEMFPIHGGSLRIYAQPAASAPKPTHAVADLAEEEKLKRMTTYGFYREFSHKVEQLKAALTAELARRKAAGQTIAAYGASAKGSTLMNYFGIGPESIDFLVDRSTVKQGHYSSGNHLKILPTEALLERMPDSVLLLTWNFADEIFRQQAEYLKRGGEFIVPIPAVRIVGREAIS